jgi:hypothetical protein
MRQTIEINKKIVVDELFSMVGLNGMQCDISVAKMDAYRKGVKEIYITMDDVVLNEKDGFEYLTVETYRVWK